MIDNLQQRALRRTKILQGQLKGLEKMIEGEEYCVDILTQSLAIQRSLASLNKVILENHLRTHVADAFHNADNQSEQDTLITELLNLYELNNIRGK